LTKDEKFSAKFNTFALKRFMFATRRDVSTALQVVIGCRHELSAFDHDKRECDHVKLVDQLASFGRKLLSIRRILLNLDNDHVKLSGKLLCSDEIASNFARNFCA